MSDTDASYIRLSDRMSRLPPYLFGEINRLRGRVSRGRVATELGEVEANGMVDGLEVDILIRPEALRLERAAPEEISAKLDGITSGIARVMAARLLGRTSLVHLSVERVEGEDLHLHARVPGRFLPQENEVLRVHLDRSQTFVFAGAEVK